jgi:hypothetical protein
VKKEVALGSEIKHRDFRSEWIHYNIMENFNEEIRQQIAKEV